MKLNYVERLLILIVSFLIMSSTCAWLLSQPDDVMVTLGILLASVYVIVLVRLFNMAINHVPGTGEPPSRMPNAPPGMASLVLHEVGNERARQDAKWGEQNHPDFTPTPPDVFNYTNGMRADEIAKCITDLKAKRGTLSFLDILNEEVVEASVEAAIGNTDALRVELIQVAAVAVSWVEAIDRRKAKTTMHHPV